MKINSISLAGWMNHASTEIDLNRLNIIVGLQYQGKTAILEAIQHALLGYSPRVPEKEHIPELDRGEIELDIEGLGPVRRTVHPNGLQVSTWSGNLTAQQGALLNRLGITAAALEAALTTTSFIGLSSAEQKRMIFALSGLRFTADQIRDMVKQAGEKYTGDLVGRLNLDFDEAGPEVFAKLYKDVFDSRRDAKRDLKKLEASGAPIASVVLPKGITPLELPAAQKLLKQLREERDGLMRKLPDDRQIARDRQRLEQSQARIAEIENGIRSIVDISDDYLKAEKYKKRVDDELRKIVNDTQAAREEIAALGAQRAALEAQIKQLGKFNGKCPLLAAFPCPADPRKIEELRADLTEKAKKLQGREDKLVLGLETSGGKLSSLEAEHYRLDKRMGELDQEKSDRAAFISELEGLRNQVAEDEKVLSGIPDASAVKAEIATLDSRIAEGEKLIELLKAAAEYNRKAESYAAELSGKQQEVADLEALVEILGPQGLVKNILAYKVGPIEQRANAMLSALTGGTHKLSFVFEPDFGIMVEINGNTLPLRKLSHSQRSILVGICLQDALCQLTGLRFLLIDNAEMLDALHRQYINDFLDLVRKDYDQIFIAATITTRDENGKPIIPPAPEAEDTSLFCVAEGVVRQIYD